MLNCRFKVTLHIARIKYGAVQSYILHEEYLRYKFNMIFNYPNNNALITWDKRKNK